MIEPKTEESEKEENPETDERCHHKKAAEQSRLSRKENAWDLDTTLGLIIIVVIAIVLWLITP